MISIFSEDDQGMHWKNEVGEYHRLDGPALITSDHSIWYRNGFVHREGGPACIFVSGSESWVQNGHHHCLEGPARRFKSGMPHGIDEITWFVRGVKIDEMVRDWMEQMSINRDWKSWTDSDKMLFALTFRQ
jgi:hypothetical protein